MESVGGGGGGGSQDGQLPRAMSNRTLLDVICDEGGGTKESKRTWRHFKEKLKGHDNASGGRGSAWTSTVPVPASDIPISNNKHRIMARNPSTRVNSALESDPTTHPDITAVPDARCSSLLRTPSRPMERASGRYEFDGPMKRLQMEEHEEEEEEDEVEEQSDAEEEGRKEAAEGAEERPVRMSLMSLLAETDEDGIGYGMGDDDDDEEEEDGGVEYNNCCICMVRHKGTAFEPCGHSFCRLCSREMWVQGGNCPLCNNYILEILDIF